MASLDSIMNEDEGAESTTAGPCRPPSLSRNSSGHWHGPPSQPGEEGGPGRDHITPGQQHVSSSQQDFGIDIEPAKVGPPPEALKPLENPSLLSSKQTSSFLSSLVTPERPTTLSSTIIRPAAAPRSRSKSKKVVKNSSSAASLLKNKRSNKNLWRRNLGDSNKTVSSASPSTTTTASASTTASSSIDPLQSPDPDSDPDAMDHGPYVESAHMVNFSHRMDPTAQAMRPYYHHQPVVESEFPYPRVTPRTGRLSRAKKGLPVHYCEPCNKWFTRAEHLRRHQLSHESPQFKCSFDECDRAFFRKDLLERHVQRHSEQEDGAPRSSSGSESPKPRTPRTPRRVSRPHSQSPRPSPYPMALLGAAASMDMRDTGYGMAHARRGSEDMVAAAAAAAAVVVPSPLASSPMGSSTMSSSPMGSPHYQSHGTRDYAGPDGYPSHSMSMMGGHHHHHHHHGHYHSHHSQSGPPPHSNHHHHHYPPVPESMPSQAPRYSGSSVDLYSLGSSGPLPPPNAGGSVSSAADSSSAVTVDAAVREGWHSSATPQPQQGEYTDYYAGGRGSAPNPPPPSSGGYYPSLMSMTGMSFPSSDQMAAMATPSGAAPLYVGSSSSSHPSEVREAQTSGVLVPSATCSVPPERAVEPKALVPHGPGPGSNPVSEERRTRLSIVSHPSSSSLSKKRSISILRPQAPPHDALAAIPELLEYYWRTVSSLVHIVHPFTFERTHGRSIVLRCAMAVLASQVRGTREDMVWGMQLYEHAWPMCVEQAQSDAPMPLSLLAAIAILELFGRFRSRRPERLPSDAFKKAYIQTYNSTLAEHNAKAPPSHDEESWIDWIEAETSRRIFSYCYIIDVHMSRYFEHPVALSVDVGQTLLVPLACGSAALWESDNATMWSMIARALGTTPVYITPAILTALTPSSLNNYSRLDRYAILATLLLRPSPIVSGVFANVQVADVQSDTQRFVSLYGNCALTNTYLMLRYTPLHDLLAVSGDTWVLGQKLDAAAFAECQRRLKGWRASHCAHTATAFAARALVSFMHTTSVRQSSAANTPTSAGPTSAAPSPVVAGQPMVVSPTTPSTPSTITVPVTFADQDRSRIMTSHHWSMYVCALVCWAFGHHARKKFLAQGRHSPDGAHVAGMAWLRDTAGTSLSAAREYKETRAANAACVPAVVRRVLETDEEMPFRSWLFVEAVEVLRKLE